MKVVLGVKSLKIKKPAVMVAKLRAGRPEDVSGVCALQDFVEDQEYENGFKLDATDFTKKLQDDLCVVCVADGMLIAYAFAVYRGGNRYGEFIGMDGREQLESMDICEIVIHPEYRGNGLQSVLLSNIEGIARQVGMKRVLGCVPARAVRALNNFMVAGYHIKATVGDTHLMEKEV